MATCHVVAMPYPGRGHVNPMMNLCKKLASRSSHILVTFVVTEEWLGFIGSETKPDNVRFSTIPNVLPSELGRAADMVGFLEAVRTKMEEPFERLLDRLETPATVIVADAFFNWAVDVGHRRNMPVASFWAMPASVFSMFYHFDLVVQNGHFPVELSEKGEELVDYIPGLSPIRLADIPTIFHMKDKRLSHKALHLMSNVPKSQYLLFSSILELESPVVDALQLIFQFPIYSLGPLIPYFNLEHSNSHTTACHDDPDYFKWLDSQPQNSVLYVSLGSYLSVSSTQMDEIVAGLLNSGVRCLWVARDKASTLKEACGNAGMVVPWCDQLKVLCHSSVGGFLTHCGWNSTMESIFAGVPMLTLPLMLDQAPNCKFIVEDWKIGWKLKKWEIENLVPREEIADLARAFMDLENPKRKEMMKRSEKMKEICRGAIQKGGSSESNLDAFIKNISK
ncbi:unnamed protein product [Camellia sinensis]